ncbi:reverse transcriptase [Elysia marginata]|uniref:Reverse transcriptase n=1 Tax=Elysia marginata TaxID=1093978 RepID=A0AAV4HU15_9GAST|nr:reverse transcriptase [Elysia marginata]
MNHVPEDIQLMVDDYCSGFGMMFSTRDYTTNWINLEVGIAKGCTISPTVRDGHGSYTESRREYCRPSQSSRRMFGATSTSIHG